MRYLLASLFASLLIGVQAGHAQTHLDSLLSDPPFATGDSLQQAGQYQAAIIELKKVAPRYRRAEQWLDYFYTENKIIENLWRLAQYDTAWQRVQRVREQSDAHLGERHPIGIYTYFNIAFLHHIYGRYDEALKNYHTALAIAQQHPNSYPLLHDDLYHGASISYTNVGRYESAIAYCQQGLAIRVEQGGGVEMAKSYSQLGAIHNALGNRDSSLWYNQRALSIKLSYGGSSVQIATSYAHVGRSYSELTIYDSSSYYYHRALATYKSLLGDSHHNTARIQGLIGTTYYDQGLYHTAVAYYKKAINTFVSIFGQEHSILARYHLLLGNTYMALGENEKALESYYRSLRIPSENHEGGTQYLYNNISHAYTQLLQYDSAMMYICRALSIGKSVNGAQHYSMASFYHTMGDIFCKQSQYDSALHYYDRALSIWGNQRITTHPDIATLYQEKGKIYSLLEDYKQAMEYYQKSLNANQLALRTSKSAISNRYISDEVLLSTIEAKAQTLRKYYEYTENLFYLKKSFKTYLQYDSLLNQVQMSRYRQDDKLFTQQKAKKVYEEALEVGMLLQQLTQRPLYWQSMFQLAEQSRSVALRSALMTSEAKKYSSIPPSVLQQERALKIKRAQYQSLLRETQLKADTVGTLRYQAMLLNLNQKYDSLILRLEDKYPRYYQLKYETDALTIATLQRSLPLGTTMLMYFVGNHIGYTFVITPQDLRVVTFAVDSSLLDQVRELREAVQSRPDQNSYQQFLSSSYKLYHTLVQPAIRELDSAVDVHRLLIIPDSELYFLPFELLLTESPSFVSGDYRTLPYLMRQHRISYSYSSTWHFRERISTAENKNLSYLAVAPSYEGKEGATYHALGSGTTSLVWNQKEVTDLDTYLKGKSVVGAAATEQQFKQEAEQHSILHLATHTVIDNEQPDQSGLVFAPPADSTEDGMLKVHELYAMELSAQLAVLSACETGMGKLTKGEGVISLARAFAYAGCPSIVMSQWAVDDQATAQLMKQFYQNLADGLAKDDALHQAKLVMLATDGVFNNPFYWAGFVLVGDTQPLLSTAGRRDWLAFALGGGGLLVFILLMFSKLKERFSSSQTCD